MSAIEFLKGAYHSVFPNSHDHGLVQTDDPTQTEEDSAQLEPSHIKNRIDVESSMLELYWFNINSLSFSCG